MKNTKTYSSAPAAERSEAERSEGERSVATGASHGTGDRPDPEVVARAKRRIFTGEYKQRILAEADKAKEESGGIGALLRREGLYSSHLVTWRHERAAGILHALTPQKRGPKSKRNSLDEENQKLRRDNQHLSEELRKAEIVIDIQKKVAALLGRPLCTQDREPQL
jgi:transposase-like protein